LEIKNLTDEVETVEGLRLTVGQSGVVRDVSDAVDPIDDKQVKLCTDWFAQAKVTPTPSLNSFWLKHVVENWAGTFISNGAVIIAAYRAGFPIGRDSDNQTVNVTIGVSTESVDEFDCGCGHP